MGIVNALAMVSVILFLSLAFHRRVEETIPATIGCWMFLLLVLAVLRRLLWIDAISTIIVIICVVLLVAGFASGRVTSKKLGAFMRNQVLTPGLIAAVIMCLLFLWSCSAREVYHPDEIQYWGTFTRSLWVSNGFVDALRHCTPLYASYAPGMQLLQWSVMHMAGGWHESLMYSVLFFCNASFLLPLLADVSWKQWWKAILFVVLVVVVPTCLTSSYYAILSTDSTLGILFGLALVLLMRGRFDGFEKFLLAISLSVMVMVKESGAALILLTGLFLLLSQSREQRKSIRSTFLAPVICFILWRGYCALNGLGGMAGQQIASVVRAVVNGNWTVPKDFARVTTIFIEQLATMPGNKAGWWGGSVSLMGLPTLIWFLVFAALPLMLWNAYSLKMTCESEDDAVCRSITSVSQWRIAVFPVITFFYYLASMILIFLTAFAPELPYYDANNIPMMERYGAPLLMGIFILSMELGRAVEFSSGGKIVASIVVLAFVVCFANWIHLQNLIPAIYDKRFPDRVQADTLRQESWLIAIDDPSQTRILNLNNEQVDTRVYALPPLSFVGIPTEENSAGNSMSQLNQYLIKQGVTHVRVKIHDSALLIEYSELFGVLLQSEALYLFRWEQGVLMLQKVFPRNP